MERTIVERLRHFLRVLFVSKPENCSKNRPEKLLVLFALVLKVMQGRFWIFFLHQKSMVILQQLLVCVQCVSMKARANHRKIFFFWCSTCFLNYGQREIRIWRQQTFFEGWVNEITTSALLYFSWKGIQRNGEVFPYGNDDVVDGKGLRKLKEWMWYLIRPKT